MCLMSTQTDIRCQTAQLCKQQIESKAHNMEPFHYETIRTTDFIEYFAANNHKHTATVNRHFISHSENMVFVCTRCFSGSFASILFHYICSNSNVFNLAKLYRKLERTYLCHFFRSCRIKVNNRTHSHTNTHAARISTHMRRQISERMERTAKAKRGKEMLE